MFHTLTPFPPSHAFFTRRDGVSEGVYHGLNVGLGSHDNQTHVQANRRKAMQQIGLLPEALTTLYQVHSAEVVVINSENRTQRFEADAMVTKEPGIALGILTADCGPVLCADRDAGVIAASHAGWKGAVMGVLENTLEAMVAQGAALSNIHAAIGPLIATASYEVGQNFKANVLAQDAAAEAFLPQHPHTGIPHFDLRGYISHRLTQAGVESIHHLPDDTYMLAEDYYSFRRSVHLNEEDYGRGLSAIWL